MADKHYTRDELEELTVEKLEKLASKRDLTVTRGDGDEGDPLKSDYVEALATSYGAGPGAAAASEPRADTTVPGGSYINAAGERVNAHGKKLDKSGNVIEDEE